jgi:hypothetical protein
MTTFPLNVVVGGQVAPPEAVHIPIVLALNIAEVPLPLLALAVQVGCVTALKAIETQKQRISNRMECSKPDCN